MDDVPGPSRVGRLEQGPLRPAPEREHDVRDVVRQRDGGDAEVPLRPRDARERTPAVAAVPCDVERAARLPDDPETVARHREAERVAVARDPADGAPEDARPRDAPPAPVDAAEDGLRLVARSGLPDAERPRSGDDSVDVRSRVRAARARRPWPDGRGRASPAAPAVAALEPAAARQLGAVDTACRRHGDDGPARAQRDAPRAAAVVGERDGPGGRTSEGRARGPAAAGDAARGRRERDRVRRQRRLRHGCDDEPEPTAPRFEPGSAETKKPPRRTASMRWRGLEPPRPKRPLGPQPSASTNSATSARARAV